MNSSQNNMTAIVLAGQRDGEDELAQHAGVTCKAFVEIDGQPMLSRVLETLERSDDVGNIILCGPTEEQLDKQSAIKHLIQSGKVSWLPPQSSPSTSAYHALRTLKDSDRVLLTTADHPLLSAEIINEFSHRCSGLDADVVIGFAPYSLVREAFPTMKKTVLRFRNNVLCGCNLFAFLTPESREAANFWRALESQRKKPLRIIRFLGWMTVLKYLLGRLTIEEALQTFMSKLGLKVGAVILPFADAAVDVDSVSDYQLVQERILQKTAGTTN